MLASCKVHSLYASESHPRAILHSYCEGPLRTPSTHSHPHTIDWRTFTRPCMSHCRKHPQGSKVTQASAQLEPRKRVQQRKPASECRKVQAPQASAAMQAPQASAAMHASIPSSHILRVAARVGDTYTGPSRTRLTEGYITQ